MKNARRQRYLALDNKQKHPTVHSVLTTDVLLARDETKRALACRLHHTLQSAKTFFAHLSVEELLVVRHGLLLVHAQDRAEEVGRLRLEHVHDVAVGPPVQREVLDQAVLRRFHLHTHTQEKKEKKKKCRLMTKQQNTHTHIQ